MKISPKGTLLKIFAIIVVAFVVASCARMGNPDGGWYDETPPRVVGASPSEKATNVNAKKVYINFDEFIKVDNPTEKVVVSPPQIEAPEIKAQGKRIAISLLDSLKANTTYTIDFSDAISDNNEGNPMGNYTYCFSTGNVIDTLEVAGSVLAADNLEPVKGILVGLYADLADSAFSTDTIIPSFKADVRQDTLWRDTLHIDVVKRVDYTHFLPDDVCLLAFNEINTDRIFLKSERPDANRFSLFYSYGSDSLPKLKGLNFNITDSTFTIDASAKRDTITYWLNDTALVNCDSLELELRHLVTDTLGHLVEGVDTIQLFAKIPYEKRLKAKLKDLEKWQKAQDKKKRKGEPYDSIPPIELLKYSVKGTDLDPDKNVEFAFNTPLKHFHLDKMHLYSKPPKDSLWYEEKFKFDQNTPLLYTFRAEWKPGYEYSLELDSLVFEDIYGTCAGPSKQGLKVKDLNQYATIMFTINGMEGKNVVCQLLNTSDNPVKEVKTTDGNVQFYYVAPGTYYLRLYVDENNNGMWDTGVFAEGRQPEPVYYYHEAIQCKANWDFSETWTPTARSLSSQKPSQITKQKADKKKTVKSRNLDRAKSLGIQYVPKVL